MMTGMLPRDFSSVDRKASMKIESLGLPLRPPQERVKDFDEAIIRLDEEWAMHEALRCIHCADPALCSKVCPAGNDISYAMWLIENGQFLEAASIYRQTSSLPEVCGRICPQEKLCEGAYVRRRKDNLPVPTGVLEAFTTHYERRKMGVNIPIGKFTGKKVAIIGAGPAGLACAKQLVRRGHWVTLFDTRPAPGGLLIYGIPNFKLSKKVVFDIWDDLLRAGVTFVGNTYFVYSVKILSDPRNRSWRLPVVIVDDTSQDVASKDQSFCGSYWFGYRKVLVNALVRTSMVVVFTILFKNTTKMVLIQDQDRVQTFLTN
jgi:ferredoxin